MPPRIEPAPIPVPQLVARPRRLRWLVLFAVAFALRAAYAALANGPGTPPSSDAAVYDTVAWNLARSAGFSLGGAGGPYPTAFVPPVMPWLASLVYRVAGHEPFAAVLAQCAVGALVPALVAALGAMLFGASIGWVAAWLAAVHPLLVFFSGYLLTETTFCVALLAALLASLRWVRQPGAARAVAAGLAWGVAALTRPTALPLPLLVAAWAWAPLGLALGPRERLRHAVMLALGLALAVGPWTVRNALTLGAFVPVTTGGGRALLDGNNPLAWQPGASGGARLDLEAEPYASLFAGRSEPEADALARGEALRFIAARPGAWPRVALAKLGRFWRLTAEGGGTGDWQRRGSPLAPLAARLDPLAAWSALVLPLAAWGLLRAARGPRRWFQALPALVIVYFTLVAVAFWGALRMRVPVEPLVVLLAAVGLEDVRRRLRSQLAGLRVIGGRR